VVKRLLPIRWSLRALDTLDEGLGYIAQFNPEAARKLRLSIQSALKHIQAYPESARMVPEEGDPDIREILREPFRIIYEIHEKEFRILVVRRMERAPLAMDDL
jgi:plasmid stabilization system protein ParE